MPTAPGQIFAFSGILRAHSDIRCNADLIDYAVTMTGVSHPRVCYLPTGVGDSPEAVDAILRDCWQRGVALAGPSAGSLCWHTGGPTDSFGDHLEPFLDGLGLVPFSNGVHDDFAGQPRRATYRRLVAEGTLGAGYATEDGVGLHYRGTTLERVVSIRPSAAAWWVEPDGSGGFREERLPGECL